ncbi:HPP family protein [Haladaptatus caseinilyticus]|uniref:HPP family protein n=1 Tax=Haladaptatus caseinilyticus TaxID=2993314 RepID=UPI003898EE20
MSKPKVRGETPRVAFVASILLVLLGALAWASGLPFLFPSLGPSAFLLSSKVGERVSEPRRVVGGHVIGVVVGLFTYHLVAPGLTVMQPSPPFSMAALRLSLSGILAVGLTTAGMVVTDLRHPPACATTLIVALGLLTKLTDGVIVVVSIAILVAVQQGLAYLETVPPAPDVFYRGEAGDETGPKGD